MLHFIAVQELSLHLNGPFQHTYFLQQVWKVIWSARPHLSDQSRSGTDLHWCIDCSAAWIIPEQG